MPDRAELSNDVSGENNLAYFFPAQRHYCDALLVVGLRLPYRRRPTCLHQSRMPPPHVFPTAHPRFLMALCQCTPVPWEYSDAEPCSQGSVVGNIACSNPPTIATWKRGFTRLNSVWLFGIMQIR